MKWTSSCACTKTLDLGLSSNSTFSSEKCEFSNILRSPALSIDNLHKYHWVVILLQRIVLPGRIFQWSMSWPALLERVKDETYLKTARLTNGAKTRGFNSREKRPFFCPCVLVRCLRFKTCTHTAQSFAKTLLIASGLEKKGSVVLVSNSQPNGKGYPTIYWSRV